MSKVFIQEGCYVDELHGQYAPTEVCRVAHDFGWCGQMPTDIEDSWDQSEDAIDWLNDNVAEDGYLFGWHEGNLMYWSHESWQQVA
jgi:hypothetical protein